MKVLGEKNTVVAAMLLCYASPIVAQSPTPTPLPAYTIPPPVSSIIPTTSPTTPPTATPEDLCKSLSIQKVFKEGVYTASQKTLNYAQDQWYTYVSSNYGGVEPTEDHIATDPALQALQIMMNEALTAATVAWADLYLLYLQIADNCPDA